MLRLGVLLLAIVVSLFPVAADGRPQNADPTVSNNNGPITAATAAGQPQSVLAVQVQILAVGGPPPPPDPPQPGPTPQPAANLPVRVRGVAEDPGATVEQLTDDQGQASFWLPGGLYWVYVPREARSLYGFLQGAVVAELPDGTPVLAQSETAVPETGDVAVTLVITIALP